MFIVENIITSLELLSDKKSFSLGIHSTRSNLWLLMHFKHLKIKNQRIVYQINSGIRQRKSTVYPIRNLVKKFDTTDQFLTYLSNKRYDMHYVEFEFTNGWKIKEQPQINFYFYTNSTSERNDLINKFFLIAGHELINIESLAENITYYYNPDGTFYILDNLPGPDEFWSEKRKKKWKEEYSAIHYPKKNEENTEEVPFVYKPLTLDKDKEFNIEPPF